MSLAPFRLLPRFDPRPWGRRDLRPWFPQVSRPTGEVWFHERNQTSLGVTLGELVRRDAGSLLGRQANAAVFPILCKFIFTNAPLSIQVHPDDDYARRRENQWGKIELWYLLRTDPEARLALGFREPISPERLREAALSGEIERLLDWKQVHPGDVFVIYPGTVHTLGAGVVLAEIQQNSDLTYRIYDYQRPRPLQLDRAAAVAHLGPYPGCPPPLDLGDGRKLLARTGCFATELLETAAPCHYRPQPGRFEMLLILEGRGRLAGQAFQAGECWFIPAAAAPFELHPEQPLRLLRSYPPGPVDRDALPGVG